MKYADNSALFGKRINKDNFCVAKNDGNNHSANFIECKFLEKMTMYSRNRVLLTQIFKKRLNQTETIDTLFDKKSQGNVGCLKSPSVSKSMDKNAANDNHPCDKLNIVLEFFQKKGGRLD